jgi:hypothetical protein
MITCPWCGTSYVSFQTNCSKCGGPIPLPPKETKPQFEPERPPMAPRPFSDSFIWKLIFSDGWAIAASIFLLLGGIFAITGIPLTLAIVTAFVGLPFAGLGLLFLAAGGVIFMNRYQKAVTTVKVLREGQAVLGQILSVDMNYSVQVNGRNPWIIKYAYQVAGRNYQGEVTTLNRPGSFAQAGNAAYVLYLPDAPENNSLYPHP